MGLWPKYIVIFLFFIERGNFSYFLILMEDGTPCHTGNNTKVGTAVLLREDHRDHTALLIITSSAKVSVQ